MAEMVMAMAEKTKGKYHIQFENNMYGYCGARLGWKPQETNLESPNICKKCYKLYKAVEDGEMPKISETGWEREVYGRGKDGKYENFRNCDICHKGIIDYHEMAVVNWIVGGIGTICDKCFTKVENMPVDEVYELITGEKPDDETMIELLSAVENDWSG